jgi:flagellar biosynthesis anti-sigma factor FlgM
MKIEPNKTQPVKRLNTDSLEKGNNKNVQGKIEGKSESDQPIFSSQAQLLSKVISTLHETSDVRVHRVEELRELIDSGKYEINYSELAKRIVTRLNIG